MSSDPTRGITLVIALTYLVAAVLFIVGLKLLSSPRTARRGNAIGALGMLLAISATLLDQEIIAFRWIVLGFVIGTAAGIGLALAVKMTAMPQMVALLNGFGGAASAIVAAAEYHKLVLHPEERAMDVVVSIMATMLIGAVTFTGSMIAFAKLQELMPGRAITFTLQKTLNFTLLAVAVGLSAWLIGDLDAPMVFTALSVLSLLLGVLLVIPIGGADMPVVISLLNSYSGMAGAAAGFVLHNNVLIISGALVGASGIILTQIMCRAMNRSLANVLFGAFGATSTAVLGDGAERPVRTVRAEDAAVMLGYARTVVFVPGYGLAVAQA
jgi:NAD(P) transhydrogenase subunit beta